MADRQHFPALFPILSSSMLSWLLLAGCGGALPSPSAITQGHADAQMQGKVHGGQQPVSGSTVQLYAVGSTGDGSASTALLTVPAITDANGNFAFAGFTCPASNPLVYLTDTGGNPGLPVGATVPYNTALSMMAVVGPCASITTSTFIIVNELTTVAAVFPLAPFMTSVTAVGASITDASLLVSAFTSAQAFVNSSNGQTPGPMLPSGATDPIPTLNTLADIAAACINSGGGTAGNVSSCGNLFLYTPNASGTYPTDTVTALLNVAHSPTANTANLLAVAAGQGPFQPQVPIAPQDLTPVLLYPPTFTVSPSVLNFPDTPQSATSASQTITLTNPNTTAVYTGFKSFGGTNAGDFSITGGTCAQMLEPSGTCTYLAVFTPGAGGARTGLLTLTPGVATVQRSVQLNGNGIAGSTGIVTLTPASVAFPTYSIGSTPVQITLHNYSAGTVTIYSIQLGDNVHYSQTNTCGTTLASLATCTISPVPVPTATTAGAAVSTTLSVLDSSASSPQTATLSFTPTIGTTVTPMPVSTWPVGFSVPGPSFSVSGTPASVGSVTGDFSVTSSGCSGGYNMCLTYTTFKPSAIGARPSTFAANYPIPFVGYGATAGPSIAANVSSIIFPAPAYPGYPYSSQLEAVNNGTTTITPSITLNAPHPEIFTFSPCTSLVPYTNSASNYECAVNLAVKSGYSGLTLGTLTFTDTTSGVQTSVPISGSTGTYTPIITISGSVLPADYPNTHVGSATPITFTGSTFDPMAFSITGSPNFTLTGPATCPYGNQSCTTIVAFTPTVTGNLSGTLTMTDTVTGLTYTNTLQGTGGKATFSVSPAQYDFGTKTLGTVKNTTFTVTNTGDGTQYCPGAGTLTGTGAADYTVTVPTVQVAPGKTCTIQAVFQPSAPGSRPATYTFQTSPYYDLVQPSFSLTGTGTF